jgi:hypothetical protein
MVEVTAVDDDERQAPSTVIGAVAAGVAPLPFLAVYSVLFVVHGFIYPVQPPDITASRAGEAVAGVITVVLFVLMILTLWWFETGRRRWPFVLGQLATLATAIDFIADSSTGSPAVPFVLALTSAAALALGFAPASWLHVGRTPWAVLVRRDERL